MELYKYRVWCDVDQRWEYTWKENTEPAPTACPFDTAHAIDPVKTSITEYQQKDPVDGSGRAVVRPASTEEGWGYTEQFFTFEVGKFNSSYGQNVDGTLKSYRQAFYEIINSAETLMVQGAEELDADFQIRIDANCVRSDLIITPAEDIEIVGGSLSQLSRPISSIMIWVEAGVVVFGHTACKEFISGKNLRFMGTTEKRNDGRSSKKLLRFLDGLGATECNEFRLMVRHELGVKHPLEISLEFFRP